MLRRTLLKTLSAVLFTPGITILTKRWLDRCSICKQLVQKTQSNAVLCFDCTTNLGMGLIAHTDSKTKTVTWKKGGFTWTKFGIEQFKREAKMS